MKRFKKAAVQCVSLALAMSLAFATAAYAKDITLQLNGEPKAFTQPITNANGTLLVDGVQLANALHLKAQWSEKDKSLTLSNQETVAIFMEGNTRYTVNGTSLFLKKAVERNGESSLLLPVRDVCSTFGAKVYWNATNQTVEVTMEGAEGTTLDGRMPIEKNAIVLTYDEAVEKTISVNSSIPALDENRKLMQQQRKDLIHTYNTVSMVIEVNPLYGVLDESSLVTWLRTANTLDTSMASLENTKQVLKETSEFMVRNAVSSIKNTRMDIILLEENIALSKANVANMELKKSVGAVSDNDVRKAKQDLEKLEKSLSMLKLNLSNQKLALNRLLGYKPEDSVEVEFSPVIKLVEEPTYSEITGKINSDPTIKQKEVAVEQAEYNITTTSYSTPNEEADRIKAGNALKQAIRDLDDAKLDMEKSIRTTYYSLQQLTDTRENLRIDLVKSKDAYQTVLVNYEAGLVTMYEVDMAKLGVLKAEIDMEKNIYTYDSLYYAYQRPFLLSGSGSSSGMGAR